ncbi:MAG: C40 family peptidase [Gemmatimonadales bacterium]
MRPIGIAVALAAGLTPGLPAQSVSAAASHWLTDPRVTDYRVSVSGYHAGPFSLFPFAQFTSQAGRAATDSGAPALNRALLGGVGADVVIRLNGEAQPYLVGGVSGGMFDFHRSFGVGLWHAWSAGAGIELLRLGGAGLGAEVRYQELSRARAGGVSLGVRLGRSFGRNASVPAVLPPRPVLPAVPDEPEARPERADPGPPAPDRALATVAASGATRTVLDAALDAMGTPYKWGGTDGNGFDCSGLIQYSYAKAGLAVPRRSVDQARFGSGVGTDARELLPGDILVFSAQPGGSASHVGLYLGDGRFIHSATGGTQISRLDPEDPAGRWWVQRWLDARRVLP